MTFTADNDLPDDIDELKKLIMSQQQLLSQRDNQLAKRDELIADLEERLALLLAKRFGRSSEKLDDNQMRLFDETELEQAIAALAKELQAEVETEEKKNLKEIPCRKSCVVSISSWMWMMKRKPAWAKTGK